MQYEEETFIEEDTRYKKQCTKDNDASVSFKVDTLGPHTVLPVAISCPVVFFLNLIDSLKSLSFQRWFEFWEKSEVIGHQIWAVRVLTNLGDLLFCQKLLMTCDAGAGVLSWWSCQSPVAHSYSLLNHPNSIYRRMLKLNAKSNTNLLLYSLSYFECDGHTVHMLTQWCLLPPPTSTVKLLFTHVHSSPLSLAARSCKCCSNCSHCINNGQTFSRQTLYIQKWIAGSIVILVFLRHCHIFFPQWSHHFI